MSKYGEAVERLARFYQFLESKSLQIPRKEITGKIGEWMVMEELIQRGHTPTFKAGQHGVDIILSDGRGVEVKSAIFNDGKSAWLFDGIKQEKFDYLVCVKLADDYSEVEYFVFTSDEVGQIPYRTANSNERRLKVYDDISRIRSDGMRDVNEKLDEFHEAWQKLPPTE
jgi:hypothetical protein